CERHAAEKVELLGHVPRDSAELARGARRGAEIELRLRVVVADREDTHREQRLFAARKVLHAALANDPQKPRARIHERCHDHVSDSAEPKAAHGRTLAWRSPRIHRASSPTRAWIGR